MVDIKNWCHCYSSKIEEKLDKGILMGLERNLNYHVTAGGVRVDR